MNDKENKKMGRPFGTVSDNPSNKMLPVKVTQSQLDNYKATSARKGKTLSAWVRENLDSAVRGDGNNGGTD